MEIAPLARSSQIHGADHDHVLLPAVEVEKKCMQSHCFRHSSCQKGRVPSRPNPDSPGLDGGGVIWCREFVDNLC